MEILTPTARRPQRDGSGRGGSYLHVRQWVSSTRELTLPFDGPLHRLRSRGNLLSVATVHRRWATQTSDGRSVPRHIANRRGCATLRALQLIRHNKVATALAPFPLPSHATSQPHHARPTSICNCAPDSNIYNHSPIDWNKRYTRPLARLVLTIGLQSNAMENSRLIC